MALEINLVPDVKDEMIKAIKLRNYIFFACIVVAIASVSVTLVFGLIAGGQQLARDSKKDTITKLSAKLNSYSELKDSLTIKDQLKNLSAITTDKRVFSRTFKALTAFIPTGADSIKISELEVNLGLTDTDEIRDSDRTQPTLLITGQADAGANLNIDYSVLDSFKKSMQYMRYDYGKYVDKEGNTIPAYCMIEQSGDGSTLNDESKGIYALWTIEAEGCNPSDSVKPSAYEKDMVDHDDQKVVKVWRTPQFKDWYSESETKDTPYMNADGVISNVPHFESECITYTADTSSSTKNPRFNEENSCQLVQDELGEIPEGIKIIESSNGRDGSENLVARFIAEVYMAPEYYNFNNTHMLALAPSGRRNVTDSYIQVQTMFSKRATECSKDDTACNDTDNGNKDSKNDKNNKKDTRDDSNDNKDDSGNNKDDNNNGGNN